MSSQLCSRWTWMWTVQLFVGLCVCTITKQLINGFRWNIVQYCYPPRGWNVRRSRIGGHSRTGQTTAQTPHPRDSSTFFRRVLKCFRFAVEVYGKTDIGRMLSNLFYARKQLLLSAHLSHCNSVRLSVCLSVTWVDQSKTVQARIIKIFTVGCLEDSSFRNRKAFP